MNLTNHFIIAMPNVADEVFGQSVVYISQHNGGAVGVIINKPIRQNLTNVFNDINLADYNPQWNANPLYLGGPVTPKRGYVLHNSQDKSFLELTNDRTVLRQLAYQNDNRLFMSVGYSEWEPQQLEYEVVKGDWLVVPANLDLVYDVEPAIRYETAMKMVGVNNLSFLYCGAPIIA